MQTGIMKYSNGYGHLIMSIFTMLVGLALILFSNDAGFKGTGVALILGVNAAWFIPGAAKQVATEVQNSVQNAVPTPVVVPVHVDPSTLNDTLPRLPVVKATDNSGG